VGQKSVLISGAGIAGPALAYWLRHRGFEPVLIEQAAHFRKGGYMIDFWGIGFDVAERMNLIPQDVQFEQGHARRFDLVAGCDGLHSAVRELSWGPEKNFVNYLGYYCASFITTNYTHREERTYTSYAEPGRQISRYALRAGRTAFLFTFARKQMFEQHPDLETAKAILRKTFEGDRWIEVPEILKRLETCDDLYFDSVSQVRMPAWSTGRIVLVGDAAYCPSLLAGEGAGFALAGAYLLGGELQRASGDHRAAFRAYEQRFRPFIERKQQSARQFASSFTPKTSLGLFVRDLVLCATSISFVSNWLMRRFVTDQFELPDYPGRDAPSRTTHATA
jgi:2-polyprenyl-6-methoxyphenol hydroxylase-like FAD-dependent oxidoreductase